MAEIKLSVLGAQEVTDYIGWPVLMKQEIHFSVFVIKSWGQGMGLVGGLRGCGAWD